MTETIVGFAGVVVGSLLIILYQVVVERRDRTKRAQYVAVRVACILDDFIDECRTVVDNADYNLGLGDYAIHHGLGDFQVPMPSGPNFPNDLDWTSIDSRLAYRVFALVNKTTLCSRNVKAIRDSRDDPFDFGNEYTARQEHCKELQSLASDIVDDIRRRWKFAGCSLGFNGIAALRV